MSMLTLTAQRIDTDYTEVLHKVWFVRKLDKLEPIFIYRLIQV